EKKQEIKSVLFCLKRGVVFFSPPLLPAGAPALARPAPPRLHVPSGPLPHLPLLRPAAAPPRARPAPPLPAPPAHGAARRPTPSELDTRRVARKSLVAARALRAGERLTADAVAVKRPGTGIPPAELSRAIDRRLRRDVAADEVLEWTALEE